MTEPPDLNNTLLEIMRDVHVIKSALYLDTSVVGNLNITRQIGRLNDLTEKLLSLYQQTTGAPPPSPASALKTVAPGTLRNFDSRKLKRTSKANSSESQEPKPPAKRGRKPRKKTSEEKIADKLQELNKQARKKQRKNYAKTRKVRGAKKGNTGQTP